MKVHPVVIINSNFIPAYRVIALAEKSRIKKLMNRTINRVIIFTFKSGEPTEIRQRKIIDKDIYEHCNICNGYGFIFYKGNKGIRKKFYEVGVCYNCKGDGILDWIEKIIGKTKRNNYDRKFVYQPYFPAVIFEPVIKSKRLIE